MPEVYAAVPVADPLVGAGGSVPALTPRARVLAALARKPVDRKPTCNPTSIINVEMMERSGASFPEANRDAELMARLAETGHTVLGFDTIMPVFSIINESSALGCEIQWNERDNWATVRGNICDAAEDIRIPKDFVQHPDCLAVSGAIRLLKKRFPDVAIVGKTMGPWSLGYHLFGTERFLLRTADDPDEVKRILHVLKEVTVAWALAQVEAGADALTLPDHATGDLVNSDYYREFLFEIHSELAQRIPCPVILHICGATIDRMDAIARTGFAAFHFDSKNNPQEAMATVAGRCALVGHVNNPVTLFRGTTERVRQEVRQACAAKVNLIGAECAVPLISKTENLLAIAQATREYGTPDTDPARAHGAV